MNQTPFSASSIRILAASLLVMTIAPLVVTKAAAQQQQQPQTPPANRPRAGRESPPQPQQQQGVDYFAGAWTYSWTGRESLITAGPRTGTVTFAKGSNPAVLTMTGEGTSEGAGAFKESGTLTWDEAKKTATIRERLTGGAEITGTGDWSSALAIRYESAPVTVQGKTLRLKRLYSIHNASSFSVLEELSTDGGPYVRLGNGTFLKK
jgi:hypothetical protein